MSLNKYMHKRNPFKNKKIDFKQLSEKYAFFKEVFSDVGSHEKITIDFKSPDHVAAISKALLLDIMKLDVYLPLDRLIPTIPLRMNYILWIEDLLTNSPINRKEEITILDIGCGASCIYPLLGAVKNQWCFKATETNEQSLMVAKENVIRNNFQSKIEVIQVSEDSTTLIEHAFKGENKLDYLHFVMCNPPFYADSMDKASLLTTKTDERDAAKSINTSIRSESLTEGGETSFTVRLINESFEYQDKVGIFTIMLGKKSSSEFIKKHLISKGIANYSIFEFCQGRVMRWGVAWSFLPSFKHPKSEFQLGKVQNRPPLLWNIPTETAGISEYSVNGVYGALRIIFNKLEIEVLEQKNKQSQGGGFHLLITAHKDTWSHQRRKRREMIQLSKIVRDSEVSGEPEAKRRKMEFICSEAAALDCGSSETHSSDISSDECVLKCAMNVVIIVKDNFPTLQLQARYIDGERESMNQVLTFVKNSLQKPI